jgi:hypothetical protein
MHKAHSKLADAYFGSPTEGGKRGRGTDKTPAVIDLSLDRQGHPQYVKISAVDSLKFNRRKFKGQLFNRLLNACVQTATITFRHLVDGFPE